MKKVLLAVAAFTVVSVAANAQTRFSIAGNVGGVTTTYGKLAAGGDLQADLAATRGLKITISGGYENFAYETNSGVKFHSSFIPLLGGAKFDLGSKLYGHAQLGYSISTISGGKGSFTYAPSIGYLISKNIDVAAKYIGLSNNYGNASAILARLAYNL